MGQQPLALSRKQHRLYNHLLAFLEEPLDLLVKELTKFDNQHLYRVLYLGPRFFHSRQMHEKQAQKERVELKRIPKRSLQIQSFLERQTIIFRPFEGMNPTILNPPFQFDARFQSGNLDTVIRVNDHQYDLFKRQDSNRLNTGMWFFFSISNKTKSAQLIRLNICNFRRCTCFYQEGMRVYGLSSLSQEMQWTQTGSNFRYEKKRLRYKFLYDQLDFIPTYFCLSFQIKIKSGQTIQLAYAPPYSLVRYEKLVYTLSLNRFTQLISFGNSSTGVALQCLRVGDGRKAVLVTARLHPSQSNSSHVLQGFVLQQISQIENLQDTSIYIVGMMNPDGVILGNHRYSVEGFDINRDFHEEAMTQEARTISKFIRGISQSKQLILALDFHGHSSRKGVFCYGPSYSICQSQYITCRVLPKLISLSTTEFRYYGCSYRRQKEKMGTLRYFLQQELKVAYCYTIESSIFGYYCSEKLKFFQFSSSSFFNIGKKIALCTGQFINFLRARVKKPIQAKPLVTHQKSVIAQTLFSTAQRSFDSLCQQIQREGVKEAGNEGMKLKEGQLCGWSQNDSQQLEQINLKKHQQSKKKNIKKTNSTSPQNPAKLSRLKDKKTKLSKLRVQTLRNQRISIPRLSISEINYIHKNRIIKKNRQVFNRFQSTKMNQNDKVIKLSDHTFKKKGSITIWQQNIRILKDKAQKISSLKHIEDDSRQLKQIVSRLITLGEIQEQAKNDCKQLAARQYSNSSIFMMKRFCQARPKVIEQNQYLKIRKCGQNDQ